MATRKHQSGPAARRGYNDATKDASPLPYWLYGMHAIKAGLANPKRRFSQILGTKNALNEIRDALPAGIDVEETSARAIENRLGKGTVHQGIAGLTDPLSQPRLDQVLKSLKGETAPRLVFLDQVTDPHNVGAIIRSAALFGAAAVVQTSRHGAPETAALVKAASGAFDALPLVSVTNLSRALDEVAEAGFIRIGLAGEADQGPAAIAPDQPIALVLGAEGKGLRAKTRDYCEHLVRLTMPGLDRGIPGLDSLNVSNAAAVALYALMPPPAADR